ncbi:alpha-tocopherol transfer protein-like [Achroia grisella]|uniref:alpha-tocopherol transfer protein-like n=1 Tax=Achroia grisella TaxID=688607 RepID=UPI0027D27025|nr:alpha-tocopherol transfer protein-like [Achroia grisella]
MEVISPSLPLVQVTAENLRDARNYLGISDVKMIKESLDNIEEWLKKQPHLVEASQYMSRAILERFFVLARGSVEGTKTKIEKLFTTRGLMPELSMHKTVLEFEKLWEVVNYVPLPKLSPTNQSRVMITQFLTDKLDEFSLLSYFRYNFLVGEFRLNYDYCVSETFVIDLNNLNITHLAKLNPIVIKKAELLCTEGFGTKISGIHIVNATPFVDKLLFILKSALKPKVAGRVHVHKTYEDLQKHIPKEILPKDYNGNEQSCSKLAEQWKEVLRTEEAARIITNMDKLITDESKRDVSKFNQEYMGMPGSFRSLNVD